MLVVIFLCRLAPLLMCLVCYDIIFVQSLVVIFICVVNGVIYVPTNSATICVCIMAILFVLIVSILYVFF